MKRKSSIPRRLQAAVMAALMAGCFSISPVAQALPTGGESDTAVITVDGKTMNITGQDKNLITWMAFSIGNGETVAFDANNYLNYVKGSSISEILGIMTGGGEIYLVNPNGIIIGDGAKIDVGTLGLSTADISGALKDYATAFDAMDTTNTFVGDVVNKGNLTTEKGITVKGNNVTFKNISDLTAKGGKVTVISVNPAHIGYNSSDVRDDINDWQYNVEKGAYTVTDEDLTKWNYVFKSPSGETLSPVKYYLVHTPAELQNMKNNMNGNYMLAQDIDMSTSKDFTPIGSESSYQGHFDGLNYAIKNLTIKQDGKNNVGLFGAVKDAVIENVGREGGSTTGGAAVGSIVGSIEGGDTIIRNVYNTGSVTGTEDSQWGNPTGGIVGHAGGGKILNVYNTGTVITNNRGGGGIVGRMSGNVWLENAYNSGDVTVKNNNANGGNSGAGGIVGWYNGDGNGNNPTIKNVYNTGDIESNRHRAGGIAGWHDGSGSLTIINAYNTGAVKVGEKDGNGIAANDVDVENSFYTQGGGDKGTKVTEEEMMKAETFLAWGEAITADGSDRNAAWRIYEGNSMPLLTAFMERKDQIAAKEYDGTEDAHTTVVASTNTSTQEEGINWVNDIDMITPKTLVVSGDVVKVYDGDATASLSMSNVEGVLDKDKEAVSLSAKAEYDNKNVGTSKDVTYSELSLSGDKAKNYSVAQAGIISTGTITRRDLELVAAAQTVIQGDETTFSGEVKGFVEGEGLTSESDLAFTGDTSAEPGTYAITGTLNGLESGEYGENYKFANAEANATALTIEAKPAPPPSSGSSSPLVTTPASAPQTTPASVPTQVSAPTPTPASEPVPKAEPQVIEQRLEESGVNARQLESATNATTPNVQSSAASAISVTITQTEALETNPAPEAPAGTEVPQGLPGDGMLSMENQGVNAPVSMNAETLAAPANGSASNVAHAGTPQGSPQNDNSAAATTEPAGEQGTTQEGNGENSEEDNERQQNEEN